MEKTTLPDRIWSKLDVRGPDECWPWQAALSTMGYGKVWDGERSAYAHRIIYKDQVGPIPDGQVIDHLCHNDDMDCPGGDDCEHRQCCNPSHLGTATQAENVKRGVRDRNTHCANGHPWNEENTYISPDPDRRGRECRACDRERKRRKRQQAN